MIETDVTAADGRILHDPTMAALRQVLAAQRHHVLGILEGAEEEDLHRPVDPFGWSPLGLVQHLTLDVERFWFRGVVAAEVVIDPRAIGDAWSVPADRPAAEVFAAYRSQIALADTVLASTRLDAPPRWWPGQLWGDWRLPDLRAVVLHVIAETACHAGHLDLVRELADGRRWMVL
ncbi:MAG: DinB family protein [Lapillicoccus sp.]